MLDFVRKNRDLSLNIGIFKSALEKFGARWRLSCEKKIFGATMCCFSQFLQPLF